MEYRQLMRQSNRYPGRPTILSPQLQDFNILEHVRHPIPCEKADFLLVLDVSFVKEDEIELSFPEDHLLKVDLLHGCRNAGELRFMRDCIYFYELPNEVDRKNLVGVWTADNFLVIKNKFPENTIDPEIVQKENVQDIESKQASPTIVSKGRVKLPRKTKEKPEDKKEKPLLKSVTTKGKADLKDGNVPESNDGNEKSGDFTDYNASEQCNEKGFPLLIPIKSNKIFKPVLSVVELKRLMSDIEDRMLCARRFIENHSFATPQEEIENLETSTTETSTKDVTTSPKLDAKKKQPKKKDARKKGFEEAVVDAPILVK